MSDEDLTVTFKRDAAEHVAVMQGFGKRLVARENARSRVVDVLIWAALGVAIFAFFNVVFLPAFDQGLSPSQARLLITFASASRLLPAARRRFSHDAVRS
ncbi:MAG: hypothetical protein H6891_11820 [Brucellaceae bacterium]|nr:hypothetical protein [Brucellaceae bacterium]